MTDYSQIVAAETALRNLESTRRAIEATIRVLQMEGYLPRRIRIKDHDAPRRRELERLADPNAYEIN